MGSYHESAARQQAGDHTGEARTAESLFRILDSPGRRFALDHLGEGRNWVTLRLRVGIPITTEAIESACDEHSWYLLHEGLAEPRRETGTAWFRRGISRALAEEWSR